MPNKKRGRTMRGTHFGESLLEKAKMTKSEENSIADGVPTGTTSESALHQGQIIGAFASVASSSTTGLDDTMHGVPEITSSMASSKTPTGATSTPATATPASSRSKSGPDTTPFKKDSYDPYRNNNNNGDGKSLRKGVPEDVMSTAGSSSTTDFQESGSSVQQSNGDGDGFKKDGFATVEELEEETSEKKDDEEEEKKPKGFRRDDFFERKFNELKDDGKSFNLDREYTYQHEDGDGAGEKVDSVYFRLHKNIKAKREREKAAREAGEKKKESDDKEEKQDSPGQAEGFKEQKGRTKEQNEALDNVRKMMNPDAKTESDESTEVGDIGETTTFGKDGDDSSSDEENGDSAPKKFSGFGSPTNKSSEDKENKDEDEDSDENENDDGDDGQISVDSDDSDAKTLKTDDMNEEEQKIWQELNCNRVYSGYICHALENEEDLHKINAPGEELKKIDSIEYRVTKAKEVEAREDAEDDAEDNASNDSKKIESVEEIPKEKYLSEDYDDLGLHEMLKANLLAYGWEAPLLVQRVGMRPIQDRQDILINAQTGSGKTGAFLIPIVNYILKNTRNKKFAKERERGETNDEIPGVDGIMGIDPRALILTPTRELAIQIAKEAVKLTRGLGRESIKVCNLYGGTKRSTQRFNAFGADIIVGTPGRVRDILFPDVMGNTRQHFDSCDFIVLDEADRMLDDGFGGISMDIIERITMKRGEKTHPLCKVLTSATFPWEIQAFAKKFLRPGYWYAQCGMLNAPSATVTQEVVEIGGIGDKYSKLDEVLERFDVGVEDSPAKALVFANTKRTVDFLGCRLSEKLKHKCITMHGDRSQQQREFALWTFATNKCPVLIATNVAARGLDIPAVDLVVNFDCSDTTWLHDDYIHRIGRTGRVGRPGTAVTFLHKKDAEKARILLNIMKDGHADIPEWIEELAEDTPESVEDDDKKDDASSASGRLAKSTKSSKSDSPTPSLGGDDEEGTAYAGFGTD